MATKTTRVTGFHLRVEQDVRNQLATLGIPPHLVEFERGPTIGQRVTFMVLIDGQELFSEPKLIEHVESALIEGIDIAKSCIAFAKTLTKADRQPPEMDHGDEGDEGDDGDYTATEMQAEPEPQRRRQRPQLVASSEPEPVAEEMTSRRAAARNGQRPPRKRFGNVVTDRKGFKRPAFLSRVIDS